MRCRNRKSIHGAEGLAALSRAAALALGLVVPASANAGTLTPTAQTRTIEWASEVATQQWFCMPPPAGCSLLGGSPVTGGDSVSAPDFEPFSASLASTVDQISSIEPSVVTASGSHAATGLASISYADLIFTTSYLEIESRSLFSLEFDLAAATPYALSASVAATGGGFIGSTLARVRLVGPGDVVIALVELEDDGQCVDPGCFDLGSESANEVGVLEPGHYTLEAEVAGLTGTFFSYTQLIAVAGDYSGSYDVTLDLEPANLPATDGRGLAVLVAAIVSGGLAALRLRRSGS